MTAGDHLGTQFITQTHLRAMSSNDFGHAGYNVGDLHRNFGNYRDYDWTRLHNDLDREGMKTPLRVTGDYAHPARMLVHGHHRAVAAMERGMMFIPTTNRFDVDQRGGGYRRTKALTELDRPHPLAEPPQPKQRVEPQHPGQGKLF